VSIGKNDKKFVKQLQGLLRALSHKHAVLAGGIAGGQLKVRAVQQGKICCVLTPSAGLVKRAIDEDLLRKTSSGWMISKAGRMALRRMLAGAEPFAEQVQARLNELHARSASAGSKAD